MNRLVTSSIFAALGIALGAFGAHGLKEILTAHDTVRTWDTAVLYHLIHAIALFAAAAAGDRLRAVWACRLWIAGILLFSGSLYGLSLDGPRLLGPITPLGGLAFIAGWIALPFENRRSKL